MPSAPAPAAAPASPTPASEVARPAYVPESHWDATSGQAKDTFGQYVNDLAARDAERESRRLTLPKSPADYKAGLPADFKPPENLAVTIDENDPLVGRYRDFAHKHGLDQAQFTEGMGIIAAIRVGEQQEFKTARDGELAKLGVNASARIDAANKWLGARGADALLPLMWTAAGYEAVEKLMGAFQSQGASSFSQAHREQPAESAMPAGFENMNTMQRLAAVHEQREAQRKRA